MSAATAAVEAPSLSPARAALADAQAAFQRTRARADEPQRPVTTGEALVAAADQAEAELDRLRAERKRVTGRWLLAGQEGERPAPTIDETKAEHVAKRARADAAAAASGLPAAIKLRNEALGA